VSLDADLQLKRGSLELECVLRAEVGQTIAVLGPNGAGKTTVLRVLAGLQHSVAGRVALDGEVLEDTRSGVWVEPESRRVGVVFQNHALFPHLSILDNVAFGLRARGCERSVARRRAHEWLERVGLEDHATSRPDAISGGQGQRVALARALITEPRLLLLDEPLASVDASAKVDLRRTLRDQVSRFQGVRILVTHDLLEAAALAERVVILEAGRVRQAGTFAEVTARPRSPWVARMAGLNLLSGDAAPGVLRLENGSQLVVVGEVAGPALATIQPRAVGLHRERPGGSPRNVLPSTIAGIDPDGDRWRVRLDGSVPLVAEVTPAAAQELHLADGGTVFASIKATEIDVYAM
jgi:molybdate transport system ATP-binding protein